MERIRMRLSERLARQYRGFKAWITLITFYELAVGMTSTMSHLKGILLMVSPRDGQVEATVETCRKKK